MSEKKIICCFCDSENATLLYTNLFHPYKKDHGPFSFYKCNTCGSGISMPLPSAKELTDLYLTFSGGLIPRIKKIRDNNPLTIWYNQCIESAMKKMVLKQHSIECFNWADIGAGNGDLSFLLSQKYPKSSGLAIDFNMKPELLENASNVNWKSLDINHDSELSDSSLDSQFDLVLLITVLEHVMYPDKLIANLLRKLRSGGCLYITVPDFGSGFSKLLKKKWPYMLPGEHLYIPTVKGMRILLKKECEAVFKDSNFEVCVKPVILPYPAGYYLNYFGVKTFPTFLSHLPLRFPIGILEASVTLK